MIRISLPWMLDVSASLDQLDQIAECKTLEDAIFPLINAKFRLNSLFTESIYTQYLRISNDRALQIIHLIDDLLDEDDLKKELHDFIKYNIKTARNRFKEVFLAEISVLPSFLVTKKQAYDVSTLIEDGAQLFPENMLQKAPETESDAHEAGKALAFELGTACGFHAFRVTESVVRRYWNAETGSAKMPVPQSLGVFAKHLEDRKLGDNKVIESLKQMAKLHRNPIAHPDVILTVQEAIGILGIARSIIEAMLVSLPDVPPTTGAASDRAPA